MSTLKRGFLLVSLTTLLIFSVCAYSNATVTVRLSDSAGSDAFDIRNSGTTSVFNAFSNGRIGIGTTTPSAMLHIVGSSTVSSSTTLSIVGTVTVSGEQATVEIVDTTSTRLPELILVRGTSEDFGSDSFTDYKLSDNGGSLKFIQADTTDGTNTIMIFKDNTQYVGIGTEAPSSLLDVAGTITCLEISTGSITVTGTVTAAGFVGDGSQLTNVSTGSGVIVTSSFSNSVDFVTTTGTMSVGSSFLVDNSGSMTASNITSTGSITSTSIHISNDAFLVNNGSMTVTGTATVGGLKVGLVSFPNTDGTTGQVLSTNGAGVANWATSSAGSDAWTSVVSGSATTALTTTNIGIGTTTPEFELVVFGTATVSGLTIGSPTANSYTMPSERGNSGLVLTAGSVGAVTWSGITVGASEITDGQVGTAEISDGTIATADLSTAIDFVTTTGTMSVGSSFLVDNGGSMTAANITSTGSITSTSLHISNDTFLVNNGSMTVTGTATVGGLTVGAISLPNTDGTTGQVLSTDGSGNISWAASGGGSSIYGFVQLTTDSSTFSAETNLGAGSTEGTTVVSGTTWDTTNSKLTIDSGNGGTYKVIANIMLSDSNQGADDWSAIIKVDATTKLTVTPLATAASNFISNFTIMWVGTVNASESIIVTLTRNAGSGVATYKIGSSIFVEKL